MKIATYFITSLLLACSGVIEKPNCNTLHEGLCASISEVNQMVDEGYFDKN